MKQRNKSTGERLCGGNATVRLLRNGIAIGVLVAIGCFGCGNGNGQSEAATKQKPATVVDATTVEARDVQVTVRSVGSLDAVDSISIAPEIRGVVKRIHFEENDRVEKGQILVELDDRKLSLEVQQAEKALETARAAMELAEATVHRAAADVENMKSKFNRDKELYEGGIASEATFIQSKTSHDAALAAVEEAKAAYRQAKKSASAGETMIALAKESSADTRIAAPFAGVLGERLVSVGDYVQPGQKLVDLVMMDPLEIAFSVPEKHRQKIGVGQTAFFNSPSVPDRDFSGEVRFISPTADVATRSIKLKARLQNKEALLQPGLFGAVHLLLEAHPGAAVIPEAAVMPRGDETFVYLVNSSNAHLRKVVLGEYFEGLVEVVEGVKPGEVVITAGHQKVADGYPVRVRESNGT